jgi:hypothetical protein
VNAIQEPAVKSYFFGKGYRDLQATIVESWKRNLASAQKELVAGGKLWPGTYWAKGWAILRWTAGISIVLSGTAFFLAFSILHVALLLTFFLLIYLGFTLVYLTERCYLAWKKLSTVCPECHENIALPEYFCPCGEIHRRLIPSKYGILHHTCCKCGRKLPATFFLNRGELQARCPNPDCGHLLKAGGHADSRKAFIPIFGGPSVGKSAYLFATVQQLAIEGPRLGFSPFFVDSYSEKEFEQACQQLAQGRPPAKTLASLPRAFSLKLQREERNSRVLYLYDPAGEAFGETEGLILHKYQEYLSGLIFLIDPFTIPAVQYDYQDRLSRVRDALKPSALPAEDALSRIFISLEEHFGQSKTVRLKLPVAVVINKVDAFDLEDRIGERALQARVAANPATDHDAMRDELIRNQLIRWDQGDLVQQLEARCTRVRYFTCSSLGRMPDSTTRAFEGRGTLAPLMWILGSTDGGFFQGLRPT